MFKQVVDRARYALESSELPDVSVDKPDVTLTDLMAQSKPSLPSVSIPEKSSVAKPDTTLAPVRKEISPMGTYGMTREEFEAARGPRIGDVKRSDIGGVLKDVDISESLKAKINAFAELNQRLSEVSKPDVVEQEDAMAGLSDSLKEKVTAYRNSKSEEGIGVLREIAGGLSLQTADELEALYASKVNNTSYSVEKDRINREREEFSYLNPGAAVAAETVGIIPSAFLSTALLTRAYLNKVQ
jgi:hypothetical protein